MDAEAQRQKDLHALKAIIARLGVPKHRLYRCPECDNYRVKGEPCEICEVRRLEHG